MIEVTIEDFEGHLLDKTDLLKSDLSYKISSEKLSRISTRKLPHAMNAAVSDIESMCKGIAQRTTIIAKACRIGVDTLTTEPILVEYKEQLKLLQNSKIGNTNEFIKFQNLAHGFKLKNWERLQNPSSILIEKVTSSQLYELEQRLGLARSDITLVALEIGLKNMLDTFRANESSVLRPRVYQMLDEDISEFMELIKNQIGYLWLKFRKYELDLEKRTIDFKDMESD